MKEVISGTKTIDGTDLEFENVRYVFTDQEKALLRNEMKPITEAIIKKHLGDITNDLSYKRITKMLEPGIEHFLRVAEAGCNFMLSMKQTPSRQDFRNKLDDMLRSFKQTKHYLKQIYEVSAVSELNIYIPTRRQICNTLLADLNPEFVIDHIAAKESVRAAWIAEQHIEFLINMIETYQEKKHRRGSPGSYITDLAIFIARAYSLFGVKPTTYSDGPFAKIFDILLQILEIDRKDSSRAIKTAVKSVTN